MTLRALVVDDEPRARARLKRLLDPHADVEVVGEASTGKQAVELVLTLRPDVVFLDVEMPEMTGTEAAARLRDYLPPSVRPALVFTTAHAEHAVQAFALQGLDYLLKPIERDRLAEALRRVRQARWAASPAVPSPPVFEPDSFLKGHHGRAIASIPVRSLLCVQVEDGVAWALTVDGERTRLSGSLAQLEAGLASSFVRVSRSCIVNAERVLRIRPVASSYEVELEGGHRVSVSRRRVKGLEAIIGLS
ncbi:MAG: DNA-binding LytR/AlgR family response regulator [Kiritimatiellia bacterium]|jgi:DNA-binding LytR/AlgR family response regulator